MSHTWERVCDACGRVERIDVTAHVAEKRENELELRLRGDYVRDTWEQEIRTGTGWRRLPPTGRARRDLCPECVILWDKEHG